MNNESLLKSLSKVQEYWNIEKENLFSNIEEKYKEYNAKEQRNKINEIIQILSKETSICFFGNAAERLGNLEIYMPYKEYMNFKWERDYDGKKILLVKENPCNEVLIVNCILCNAERMIFNQITEWMPDVANLEFEANETISQIQISIWQKKQGQLIYYEMYLATLIQFKGIKLHKNDLNKGFRHICCVRKPLFFCLFISGVLKGVYV